MSCLLLASRADRCGRRSLGVLHPEATARFPGASCISPCAFSIRPRLRLVGFGLDNPIASDTGTQSGVTLLTRPRVAFGVRVAGCRDRHLVAGYGGEGWNRCHLATSPQIRGLSLIDGGCHSARIDVCLSAGESCLYSVAL